MTQGISIESSDSSKMEQQMQKFPERWQCAVEDRGDS